MPAALPFIAQGVALVAGASQLAAAAVAFTTTLLVADYQKGKARERARQAAELARRGRTFTIRSGIAERSMVLGTVRTSGPVMYAEFVGDQQQYLDIIVAVNHGELAAVQGVYLNDTYIPAADIASQVPTSGKYGPGAVQPEHREESFDVVAATSVTLTHTPIPGGVQYAATFNGVGESTSQNPLTVVSVVGNVVTWSGEVTGTVGVGYATVGTVTPPLKLQWAIGSGSQASTSWSGVSTPKWTSNHRLRGVAYVRVLKLIDHPVFGDDAGEISVLATGPVGVFDPRTSTTVNGTSNPALLAAWLRTLPRSEGGLGVPSDWIDWASVAVAANICDELITVKKLDNSGYETVKRYECNTVLPLDVAPEENLQIIVDCMAGGFPFTGGKYRCFAGAFAAATVTITDNDVPMAADITVGPSAGLTVNPPNICTATFYDRAAKYQPTAAPVVRNAAYVTADGAEEPLELDLRGVVDARQANYLMGVRLERARPTLEVQLTVTGKGANIALMQTVQLQLTGYSALAGKTFEVRRRTNFWNGRYELLLREVRASMYALDADRFVPAAPPAPPDNSILFDVDPVVISGATEQVQLLPDGTRISRVRVQWAAHPQAYVRERGSIQLRWKIGLGAWVYEPSVPGSAVEASTGAAAAGSLVIAEVRAVNAAGVSSAWATASAVQILGKTTAPANVSGLTATLVPGGVLIRWTPNADRDYLDTEARSGASWGPGALVWRGAADRYLVPWPSAGSLTLWLAHRDTSRNYSATPQRVDVNVDGGINLPAGRIVPDPGWLNSNVPIPSGTLNANPQCDKASAWTFFNGVYINQTFAPSAVGTSYMHMDGGAERMVWTAENIPINPAKRYRLTARLYAAPGNDRYMYITVRMYRADGNAYGAEGTAGATGWGGTYAGYVYGGIPTSDGVFREYGDDFGAGTARPIPSDVAYVRVGVWGQYADGTSSVLQAAQDIRLVEVTDVRAAATTANWSGVSSRPANLAELSGSEGIKNSLLAPGQNRINGSDMLSTMKGLIGYAPNGGTFIGPMWAGAWPGWTTANYNLAVGSLRNIVVRQDGYVTASNDTMSDGFGQIVACDIYIMPNSPVLPGERICGSVYLSMHRCRAQVWVGMQDAAGSMSWVQGPVVSTEQLNTNVLANYTRTHVFYTAPPWAVSMRLMVRKYDTIAGQGDSYVWIAAPQLEVVGADATGPSPYQSGPVDAEAGATVGAPTGTPVAGNFPGGSSASTVESNAATALANAGAALIAAAGAQATADGKVVTFVQTSAPTAEGVGDLWIDTDDGNALYRWNGASWVSIRDAGISTALTDAANAQATADGKVVTFVQTSAPTAEGVGDLWLDSDDGNRLYRWNGAAWVSLGLGTGAIQPEAATVAGIQGPTSGSSSWTPGAGDGGIDSYATILTDSWTNSSTESVKVEISFSVSHSKSTTGPASGNCGIVFALTGAATETVEKGVAFDEKDSAHVTQATVAAGQTLTMRLRVRRRTSEGSSVTVSYRDAAMRWAALKR